MGKEIIYWGVLCRKCSESIAFGAPCHQQFELESTFAKPGAIRCANGHTYIYFPRDFRFFATAAEIPDALMQANREAHRATNPTPTSISGDFQATQSTPPEPEPEPETESEDVAPAEGHQASSTEPRAKSARASSANYQPDPRRQTANAAAKAWWSQWAIKKVS
jgi:hypothetical protein